MMGIWNNGLCNFVRDWLMHGSWHLKENCRLLSKLTEVVFDLILTVNLPWIKSSTYLQLLQIIHLGYKNKHRENFGYLFEYCNVG